jgi:hypothetical protein
MTLLILLVVSTCCLALAAVALALRKVASPKRAHPVTAEWIEELSIERYRPMLRLLDSDDHEFVRNQSNFEETKFAEFRRDRCRLFRTYLKWLNADFASVCLALKITMLQAEIDRPDLASTLLRSQIRFATRMLTVQFQLALYEAGFGTVDVRGLLTLFDSMRLELRSLAPESAVWGS